MILTSKIIFKRFNVLPAFLVIYILNSTDIIQGNYFALKLRKMIRFVVRKNI